jgi:hypothetical protein
MNKVIKVGSESCYYPELPPLETPDIVVFVLKFLNEIGDFGRTLAVNRLWNRATILLQKQIFFQIEEFSDLCANKKPDPLKIKNALTIENQLFDIAYLTNLKFEISLLKKNVLAVLKNLEEEDFKKWECSHGKTINPIFFNNARLFAIFKQSITIVLNKEFKIEMSCRETIFDLAQVYKLLDEKNPGFFEALVHVFTFIDDHNMEKAIELVKVNAIHNESFKVICPIIAGLLVYIDGVDQAAELINSLPENHKTKLTMYFESALWIFQFPAWREEAIKLIHKIPNKSDRGRVFTQLSEELEKLPDAEAHRKRIDEIIEELQEAALNERIAALTQKIEEQDDRQKELAMKKDAQRKNCTLF